MNMNWINVKDELPKEFELVIVFTEDGEVTIGSLEIGYGEFSFAVTIDEETELRGVDLWMPLPNPPEGK